VPPLGYQAEHPHPPNSAKQKEKRKKELLHEVVEKNSY